MHPLNTGSVGCCSGDGSGSGEDNVETQLDNLYNETKQEVEDEYDKPAKDVDAECCKTALEGFTKVSGPRGIAV